MSKPIQLTLLKLLSLLGLGLTIVPSIMVYMQVITHDNHLMLMGVGMVLWFATAPFWINKEKKA